MIRRARRTPPKRKRGQYEIFEILGRGNFATVRLGKHIQLGTRVAVKELHVPLDRKQVEQFFKEARISAHLIHPNIVRILDYNVEDGVPFLVMDYAPNGTLRHLHPLGTRLPLGTVVSYVKQLAAGLQYAHSRYVIHCDVKPENMLVGRNGEILLSDFGIAKIGSADEQGRIVGTLPYMAPEQIDGTPCAESDQYAMAVVVHEWLSGMCPFQGSHEEIIYQHRYVTPPSLCEQIPTLPVAVEQVVMKALSQKPADRYPSISAFATALEEASGTRRQPAMQQGTFNAGDGAGRSPRVAQGRNPRHPLLPRIAILLLISLMLLGIIAGICTRLFLPLMIVTLMQTDLLRSSSYDLLARANPAPGQTRARRVIATTSSSKTVSATGEQDIPATQASGTLTFYNSDNVAHQILAGTLIPVPHSSLQIITDQTISIPAANPPAFGVALTYAHVVQPGADGNIAAHNLKQFCCSDNYSIQVDNSAAFSGGQDAQHYSVVQQSDIDGAAKSLESSSRQTIPMLLQKKGQSNEMLDSATVECTPKVTSDTAVGGKATSVTVTDMLTCTGEVYDREAAVAIARQDYITDIRQTLKSNYTLVGSITSNVEVKGEQQNTILLHVTITGTWRFRPDNMQKQKLLQSIAGKREADAIAQLSTLPGVKVVIQPTWYNLFPSDTLPTNHNQITLVVVSAAK